MERLAWRLAQSYTRLVYEALGTADTISFPQPAHGHCQQGGTFADQYYGAFVDRCTAVAR